MHIRYYCLDTLEFTIYDIDGFIEQETSTMKVESGGTTISYSWTMNGDIQVNQTDSIYEEAYVQVIYMYSN